MRKLLLASLLAMLFSTTALAENVRFPKKFFGVEVDKIYNHDSIPVTITSSYLGRWGPLSREDFFVPNKKLPLFPTFNEGEERAANYLLYVWDISTGEKPLKNVNILVSGWEIRKPFEGKFSYTDKMRDICQMFNIDLEGIADKALPFPSNIDVEKEIKEEGMYLCQFVPYVPTAERVKKKQTYVAFALENRRIRVSYRIEPLYEPDGPTYQKLSVELQAPGNKIQRVLDELSKAYEQVNRDMIKEKAEENRPY